MSVNTRDHSEFRAGGEDLLHHVMIASTSARLTAQINMVLVGHVGTMHPPQAAIPLLFGSADELRSHGASARRDGQSRPLSDGVAHLGEEPISKRPHVWSCLLPLQPHEVVRDRELVCEGAHLTQCRWP